MLPLFVVLPLGCAFFIPLFSKIKEEFAKIIGVFCAAGLFILSYIVLFKVRSYPVVYAVGGWKPPFGIALVLDGFSGLLLVVVNLIGFVSIIYSFSYIKRYSNPSLYYTLFSLLLAGLNGVVITGDLFNLFVFLEITSIASYALVAFGTEKEELEAAFKYLVLGNVASIFILLAIALIWARISSLNMADIALSLEIGSYKKLISFALGLFIVGFGLKSALVPFHGWLADAHPAAPAPISAMLSGVVIKTIGVYALARVLFNIIGFNPLISDILMGLGILSMLVGVLLAIGQWDFKRLLAYHSVSQIGYVVFGLGLGNPLGIIGGLFHLFNHSIFKSLLFLNSGAVEYATGTRDLNRMGGLSDNMPVTANTSLIASLSIAGVPPFCGFFSKLLIIIASFQKGAIIGGIICVLVSMITLASFLKVQKYAFRRKEPKMEAKEVAFSMKVAMVILAIICVVAGLGFNHFVNFIIKPAVDVLLAGKNYAISILR